MGPFALAGRLQLSEFDAMRVVSCRNGGELPFAAGAN